MQKHPDSDLIAQRLARCGRWQRAWFGVVFRSASPRYANRDDFFTGAGAKAGGARWNAPASFASVYTSLEPDTAVSEGLAHHEYFGLPIESALPRTLAAARVALERVLDLTVPSVRRTLGLNRAALLDEDWRAANRNGNESLTQTIGRLAWTAEWEGLLVPSAAARGGTNLIVFPGNLTPPDSYLLIINRGQLPPPPL
jgi:RES domain-containing protein